jgi:hypothetical protein
MKQILTLVEIDRLIAEVKEGKERCAGLKA